MVADKLTKSLTDFGLSDKEARVYLASLEIGPATAQVIAAKAKVNRPTAYLMIESLQRRGLMSDVQKGKRRQFVAGHPNHLRYIVAQQKREVEGKEKAVEAIIKEAEEIKSHDEGEIEVEVVDGWEGTKRVQEAGVNAKELIREVCNLDRVREKIPDILPNDIRNKIADRPFHSVVEETDKYKVSVAGKPNFIKGLRLLDKKRHVDAEMHVVDGAVYFHVSGSAPKCLIVRNFAIVETIRTMHDALYDESYSLINR